MEAGTRGVDGRLFPPEMPSVQRTTRIIAEQRYSAEDSRRVHGFPRAESLRMRKLHRLVPARLRPAAPHPFDEGRREKTVARSAAIFQRPDASALRKAHTRVRGRVTVLALNPTGQRFIVLTEGLA